MQDIWPHVLTAAGGISNKIIINAADGLTKWVYKKSDRVLVQSNAFVDYLLKQSVPREKITYYPNTTEPFYKPVAAGADYKKYFNLKHNIVFAGNIGESQAFDTLLKAAAIVKNINKDIGWIIIGDGRMKKHVIQKVTEYDLEVHFKLIGSFPPTEMPQFFACADALLMSLKKDPFISLTIPSKLQSYMACGVPVIGCLDKEGARIINEAACGVVAAAEDEVDLANKVLDFFKLTVDERKLMGSNALAYYKNEFDRELLISSLINILNE